MGKSVRVATPIVTGTLARAAGRESREAFGPPN